MSYLFTTDDVSTEKEDFYLEDYFYEDNLIGIEVGIKCNACFGTGQDRYEDVDCMTCYGYGEIYND